MRYSVSQLLLVVAALFFLLSCRRASSIDREIENFYSTLVTLPLDSMVCVKAVKGVSAHLKTDYTYVIYTDSTSCSDCTISHLTDWSRLCVNQQITPNRLSYVFIISPKRNQYASVLKHVVVLSDLGESVYIDTSGVFERRNPNIPSNKLLHTFLLDSDGNVMLIGNPINNLQIRSMLSQILSDSR